MTDLFDVVPDLLGKGEDLVFARVIAMDGSTPRKAGAAMLMKRGSGICGTIGGGIVEAAVIEKGRELFAKGGWAILEFDMTGENIETADLICGGKMEVLAEVLPARPDIVDLFAGIGENRRRKRIGYLVTELPDAGGEKELKKRLLSEGDVHDASAATDPLEEAARSLTAPDVIHVEGKRYWVDVIRPRCTVYIAGAGHVSKEVSDLAQRVGFSTVVMDERPEFANAERFGGAAEVVVLKSFEDCFKGFRMDGDSYIVIATRGHRYDKEVLEQALRTEACYVGMVGSARKRDIICRSLIDEGFTAEEVGKVYCPIGLKMASATPAEIAISIVGELINVRAAKRKGAKDREGR